MKTTLCIVLGLALIALVLVAAIPHAEAVQQLAPLRAICVTPDDFTRVGVITWCDSGNPDAFTYAGR